MEHVVLDSECTTDSEIPGDERGNIISHLFYCQEWGEKLSTKKEYCSRILVIVTMKLIGKKKKSSIFLLSAKESQIEAVYHRKFRQLLIIVGRGLKFC